jgi:ribonuclease-3
MELLREAMTHASWNNERGRPSGPGYDNERLEYLGDAVLELVVGEYLFRRFPEYDEGQLTQLRAALVNTSTLARLAERLNLGQALFVGKGAAKTGARQLPSLLANAFEALIGSIFLDQGYRVATRVFLQNIGDLAEWSDENFKGKLQEVAQERTGTTPTYRVSAGGGPGHKREYTADAVVGGEVVGTGRGGTKQAAEQAAARAALQTLTRQPKRQPPVRSAATQAARAAREAEQSSAGEPARVRRRVAEVAADRSVASRRRPRPERDAVPPLLVEQPPPAEGQARRRRGLLSAIRSAAEALVGRVVPVEPEAPPAVAPPPPAEGAPRRGGGGAAGPRGRGPQGGAARTPGRPGAEGGRRGATRPRTGARSEAVPGAAVPPRGGAGGGRRRSSVPRAAAPDAGDGAQHPAPPPGSPDSAEPRKSSRRGRRGGRGRRRPGAPGTGSEAPTP